MQNLLIVEDNLIQSYHLANSICREISNIRLYGIVPTCSEAIEIIKNCKVDIIILDLKLPDSSGNDVINFIKKNNLSKYEYSIIILTGEISMIKDSINNKYIYYYCTKIGSYESVVEHTKELAEIKDMESSYSQLDKVIKANMESLNFDFSYKGTVYLFDTILEIMEREDKFEINFDKEIYPIIAKKYNTKKNSIKVNIFNSVSLMYYNISEDKLSEYLGYKVTTKPKTKELITSIILHVLRQNYK